MSKQDDINDILFAIFGFIALILVVIFCWWSFPRIWSGWQELWATRNNYCSELKKVVKADPIFEDNGKHEDESYRITYEDGSVGLVSNPEVSSGYYCVNEQWITQEEATQKGAVPRP